MQVINKYGKDITKEVEETLVKLREILTFYKNEENYHWDGCRCHGHWVIDDHGDKAWEGCNALDNLEYEINEAQEAQEGEPK